MLVYASARFLRAARANRIFCTDEKRIRTENTVMGKDKFSAAPCPTSQLCDKDGGDMTRQIPF